MNFKLILRLIAVAIALGLVSLWIAQQSYTWFPPEASREARFVDDLFALFVFLGTFIFLGVTGTILYCVVTQSVSRFDLSDGPAIEGNTTLEVVWTAIPIVLVLVLASYSYWTYEQMAIRGPMEIVHLHLHDLGAAYAAPLASEPLASEPLASEPTEAVEVEVQQWSWTFHYPGQKVTSTELHLPINHRARLTMHSSDVIHGFYVPAFRIKQDIVPNHLTEFEFTPIREGTYPLSDSQFSGTFFAINQTNVVVESVQQYHRWLAELASRPLVSANNQPYEEYNRQNKKGFKTGWATVQPAPPPLVNQSEHQT